ncbi:Protein C54D10.10 [Aphelenchoides avenae]|nr:Protein C54D10.10 [Aphelenchus avenae]
MVMLNLSVLLMIIAIASADVGSRRISRKATGPVSEHGKMCDAPWIPNFTGPLRDCTKATECSEGFDCHKGHCCPTRETVCALPADSGHETSLLEHFRRFTYDSDLKTCIGFSYFGSAGNFNNFGKFSDCVKYCKKD